MLDVMRQRGKSIVVIAIFAIIILVFIFWGVGPMKGGSGRAVAVVNGEEITIEAYKDAYERQIDYLREALKDQFSEEAVEEMNVKERTVNILINNMLIVSAAEDAGVKVTDDDVQKIILGVPAFKKGGAFDKETYVAVLKQNRIAPAEFEENVKRDIIIEKMQELQTRGITVTDEDAWATFSGDNRAVSLEYAFINPRDFASTVEVTDDEAKKFYDEHGNKFSVPTKVKAFFVKVAPDASGKDVSVTDADVKGYYEANKAEFAIEEAVNASHILIRPAGSAEARAKAEGLLQRIKKGESFESLARKHSEDGSAAKGGSLGWFVRERMVAPFADAAFSLKKGAVSGVVETEFGYHIIKVHDRKEGGPQPLEAVKGDIKKTLALNQSVFLAREKAASLSKPFEDARTAAELEKAASSAGLKGTLTGLFSEAEADGEFIYDAALKSAIFGLNAGGVSAPVEGSSGAYYLAKVLERVEEHVPPFEEAKQSVKAALVIDKAVEKARETADALSKGLNDGSVTFESIRSQRKYKMGRTGYSSIAKGVIPDLGMYLSGANEGLMKLTADKPYHPEVVSHNMGFFLFKLADAKEADRAAFDKIRERFKERLMAVRQQEAMNKWLTDLRQKAKVTINSELL
jgi:peptidyl-prolyl cis-trans isomerase D